MSTVTSESATAGSITQMSHSTMVGNAPPDVALGERLHYFDNIRAIAMMLGVYLHAAFCYAEPSRNVWIVADRNGSPIIDASIWFLHLFRLPLFFFVAGYFAQLMVKRRGVDGFVKNRLVRIVLPFFVFYIPLVIGMVVALGFAIRHCEHLPPMMAMAKSAAASGVQHDPAPLSTMHLWFLYYLALFSAIGAILSRWPSRPISRVFDRLYSGLWLVCLSPLMVPSLYVAGVNIRAPESFAVALWPFGYYGVFFLAGWHLQGREHFIDVARPYLWPLVTAALALFGVYYWLMPSFATLPPAELTTGRTLLENLLAATISTTMVVVCLILGKRFLSGQNRMLRYISDASYWTYLIHLPLLLILQVAISNVPMHYLLKFALSLLGTLVISWATYAIFVRYTPIGTMLNGKRRWKSAGR